MGWLTVAFYFLTSFFSLRKAILLRKNQTDFRFWSILALFLLLLGINKQLDIQSFFTEIGRVISREQGWYQDRRSIQFYFVLIFGCFAFFTIACVCWVLRKKWQKYLTPLCGFLFLIAFIVIRAASFHHFDKFLNFRPFGARMNWVLELGGIGILFYSSLVKIRNIKTEIRNKKKKRQIK